MMPAPPRRTRLLAALGLIATVTALVVAVPEPASARPGAVVLLVDASGSLNDTAPSGRTKLVEVREGLRAAVSALPSGVPVGLRVFGPRETLTVDGRSTWCRGTRLVVPVGPLDPARFSAAADAITADGATPTGYALTQAAGDAAGATIVLISDGRDTCGPADPCAVARTLAGRDLPVRVHTVGVSLSEQSARDQLRCIANATGGTFAEALDARGIARTVQKALAASGLAPVRGTAVRGRPDPVTAPGVAPGPRPYTDILPSGQPRYYAVELAPRQELAVRATVSPAVSTACPGVAELDLLPPGLVEPPDTSADRRAIADAGTPTTLTARRRAAGGLRPGPAGDAQAPGTWWVRVTAEPGTCAAPPQGYHLELAVAVSGGGPVSAAGPGATEVPGATVVPGATTSAAAPALRPGGAVTGVIRPGQRRWWRFPSGPGTVPQVRVLLGGVPRGTDRCRVTVQSTLFGEGLKAAAVARGQFDGVTPQAQRLETAGSAATWYVEVALSQQPCSAGSAVTDRLYPVRVVADQLGPVPSAVSSEQAASGVAATRTADVLRVAALAASGLALTAFFLVRRRRQAVAQVAAQPDEDRPSPAPGPPEPPAPPDDGLYHRPQRGPGPDAFPAHVCTVVDVRRDPTVSRFDASRLGAERRAHDLDRMRTERFDVVVIGAGVTGAGAALDAASRGLSVALIEARDVAAGTSSRSSKLIHGGLRYLEQLNFSLVREALEERGRLLTKIAPHLVRPVPFLIPLTHRMWQRAYIGAGVLLYDFLGSVFGTARGLPRHRHLSKTAALRLFPGLRKDSLIGAIQYYDGQVDDARHTLTVARTAASLGAAVATSTRVLDVLTDAREVVGVHVRDLESGEEFDVRAKTVIAATGVWSDDISEMLGERKGLRVRASKGIHLVVPRSAIDGDSGLILRTEKSVLFVIPWGGHWIVGTTDTDWNLDRAHPAASSVDIQYILDHVNEALARPLTHADIEGVYAGLRPLLSGEDDATSKLSREHAVVEPMLGLILIAGGKYTTYRVMAEDAVDVAARRLPEVPRSRTDELVLVGGDGYSAAWSGRAATARRHGVSVGVVEHLLERYGTLTNEVLALVEADPTLGRPLTGAPEYLRAEVVYAAEAEGALHLDDVLTRRTRISIETPHRGLDSVEEVADLVGKVLGWDAGTRRQEVEHYRARVEAERESQRMLDDQTADAARLGAADVRGLHSD